ncbi:unnamed protein product, partial [Pylaiella littoralis]
SEKQYHRPSGTAVHRGEHYWLRTYRVTKYRLSFPKEGSGTCKGSTAVATRIMVGLFQ